MHRRGVAERSKARRAAILAVIAVVMVTSGCTPSPVPTAVPATGATIGSTQIPAGSAATTASSSGTAAVDPPASPIPNSPTSAPTADSSDPTLTDNGRPRHVLSAAELRAPIPGVLDRAALHQQAAEILGVEPGRTYKNGFSIFNNWNTGSSKSFAELNDLKFYEFNFDTLENADGTLTNARCTVTMPGLLPQTGPDDWPPLFDLCVNLPYRDADPEPVLAWAKDALKQLQATQPGPTPVVQQINLNCLHWQLGWAEESNIDAGYEGSVSLDVSTGFTGMSLDGFLAGSADQPTAYGCPD